MKQVVLHIMLFVCMVAGAQKRDTYLAQGNEDYENGDYTAAEESYRLAQAKSPRKSDAAYNLGNTMYKQGLTGEASYAYIKAIDVAKTKEEKHRAYHNLGNLLLKDKDYGSAVDAYKDALRNDPSDEQTRYNYALAKKLLNENPPLLAKGKTKEKNRNKKQSNKENESLAPKNKGQHTDTKAEGGNDKQEREKQGDNKEGKSGSGNRDQMPATEAPSEQRIKNLLDAINNEEKKVQERVNSKNANSKPVQQEKDW